MRFRTQMAAVAAVTMLVGLAACGGDDDDAATGTSPATDTAGSASETSPAASAGPAAGQTDGSSMITMNDNNFTPAKLTVAPGAQIMLVNEGGALHNLKDKDTKGDTFDGGDVQPGADGTLTAPTKPGTYPYLCTYHVGMEGTLTVK